MRDLTARFTNFRPLCLVCSDDYDDDFGGYVVDYGDSSDAAIIVPPPILAPSTNSLGIFGSTESNTALASIASSGVSGPGAPPTSGTIIPQGSPSGNQGSMSLIQSLERDAAQVTSNAIIENANPYNQALIENTPISVPSQVITPPKASHTALAIGLILLAGLGGFLVLREA